jgi:polynucleotide 5'-hydroxyl-kinase GRC3/NOL9
LNQIFDFSRNSTEVLLQGEWDFLIDVLETEKGITFLLGATDTGKGTLAKYLIPRLCQRGIKAALVDADIGQSFLGLLPRSVSPYSILHRIGTNLIPPEIFFVGSTTPEGNFPLHLKGAHFIF